MNKIKRRKKGIVEKTGIGRK